MTHAPLPSSGGSAIGLSVIDAWDKAAVDDVGTVCPSNGKVDPRSPG